MWKVFKRRRQALLSSNPFIKKVASAARGRLQQAAQWLQQQTRSWTKLEWQIIIVLFCAANLVVCSWIICGSFVHPVSLFSPEVQIRQLHHYQRHESGPNAIVILDDLLVDKMYLDSLQLHDSIGFGVINNNHPNMVDSLDHLIQQYQSQIK